MSRPYNRSPALRPKKRAVAPGRPRSTDNLTKYEEDIKVGFCFRMDAIVLLDDDHPAPRDPFFQSSWVAIRHWRPSLLSITAP